MDRKRIFTLAAIVMAAMCGYVASAVSEENPAAAPSTVSLTAPALKGTVTLEEAIAKRRSIRHFAPGEVTMEQLSQLLWAAQGVTDKASGHRAAPSAMAKYPLEVYVVKADGLFKYVPAEHALTKLKDGDLRKDISGQGSVAQAPVSLVITVTYERLGSRNPQLSQRFGDFEAGAAAENVFLQAAALGLGSVPVGGFDDAQVAKVIGAAANETPVIVIPIGKPAV
jgi:SagB-type dehydrogenase family enzyme